MSAFGIPECTINVHTLDLFSRTPDNDSVELKHVAISFGTGVLNFIEINYQTDATIFQFIIPTFFKAQHVSGVFPPIIRSLMTAVAASGFTLVSW